MTAEQFVPTPRVSFFSGRDAFLQTLRETLLHSRAAVIAGPEGVGKTTVAQEYVRRFAREYRWVIWINAASSATFLADTFGLARRLSLPTDIKQGFAHAFRALQGWLADQPDSLLVLDDAATTSQIAQNLPAGRAISGHLLMITHAADPSAVIPRLDLEALDARDGALLVLRQAGLLSPTATLEEVAGEQRACALELAGELGGLPVALNLAGGYLRATGDSVQNYLLAFRNVPPRLSRSGRGTYRDNHMVEISCDLILAHLQRVKPTALELLRTCALLAPDAIPGALFDQAAAHPGASQQTHKQRTAELIEATRLLLACGLLAVHKETPALHTHPLVQAAVRRSMTADKQRQQVEQALYAFHRLLLRREKMTLADLMRVAGHLQQLVALSEAWTFSFEEAAEVLSWAGSLLWEQGLLRDAEPVLRRALVIWERASSSTHPQVATLLLNLGALNFALKDYSVAEVFANRAITSKVRALGADHPDVLLCLDNLGRIYAEQGKQQEAKLCYEKAISMGKRAELQGHPHSIAAMYELALLDIDQSLFDEAQSLLQKVCAAWELSPDTQDPSAVDAWLKLAEVCIELGDWQQAETCYQRVLPACEKLLGQEHPETLRNLSQAGLVFLQRENFTEAERALQRVLSTRERTLGADHPDVAACLNDLAKVALAREQFAEALALLERAQSVYESRPQPEDLDLATVLDNRAIIETVQEKHEQAITTLQRSLDIRKGVLGEHHLDLVEHLSNLAALYLAQEQSEQAEPLLLHALVIYRHAQKPEDFTLDPVLTSLATIAMDRGKHWQAKMYLERSRSIRALTFGEEDPSTAEVLQKLALAAIAQGEWEEAEALYRGVLPVYENALGEEHPQTLECLEQVAAVYVKQSKFEEAQVPLRRIVRAREREPGEEHADLIGNLLALGQVYLAQELLAEAETYLQRAFVLYEQTPGPQPLVMALLLSGLIAALEGQGKRERATLLSQQMRFLIEQPP